MCVHAALTCVYAISREVNIESGKPRGAGGGGRRGAELFRWLLLAVPMIRLDNPSFRSLDVPKIDRMDYRATASRQTLGNAVPWRVERKFVPYSAKLLLQGLCLI
jgi:hypothetical protein